VLTVDHARSLAAYLGSAATVALTTSPVTGTFAKTPGTTPRAAAVSAVYGSLEALTGGVGVLYGRALTADEMAGDAYVAVIAHKLAVELAGRTSVANALKTPLMLQGHAWTVVGVLDPAADQPPFTVFVPAGSLAHAGSPSPMVLGALPGGTRSLFVRAPQIEEVLSVQAQIETWADTTEPRWRKEDQVRIQSQGVERLRQLNQGLLVFKLLMGSFAAISLLVGGIGIMNVLLAAVAERTREIGVRKASGATRRDIVVQFLSESVTIAIAGSLLGAVVGFLGAVGVSTFIRWQSNAPFYAAFTWQTFLFSMGTAVAVGLIFGMYPALKAARLSPVDAMRYE
jgi:putative ABC transport system permease protein